MIEFTIKTLDSNNHQFSVDDEITIQQLKEKVREQLGIEINLQRLIFCGRVLQDDKKLSDYDVNGKVVHLVQRAPPSPEFRGSLHSSNSNTSQTSNNANTAEGNAAMQQQIRRLMALTTPPDFVLEQQQAMSLSPTTGRMEFIRRTIADIKSALAVLRAHIAGEVRENSGAPASRDGPEQMDSDTTPTTQEEPDPIIDDHSEDNIDPAIRAQNARRRAIRAMRARNSRPRDLAQLIEELEALQEQFSPHRAHYVRLLRNASEPEPPQYEEADRAHIQRTVEMVTDIIHSFAHAYHAISDITLAVGQRNPRLTAEAAVMRHPIPMQAHINVIQSNRRPTGQATATATSGESAATATTTTTATAAPTAAATANATATASANANQTATSAEGNTQGAQSAQPSAQAGRNTTQPTVNINIHPDLTYQVEIETRVPIAFPIENALINGLAGGGPGVTGSGAAGSGTTGQGATEQPAGQGPTNRRQVLFDFENLFRGLGQAGGLGGVEVVMSMEEIPQGGVLGNIGANGADRGGNTAATGTAPSGNATQAAGVQTSEGGGNARALIGTDIYLAPMAWGGPPSADMLQNIVSSVIRQGLVPGMEVAVHAPIAAQIAQAVSQAQTQAQNQAQNQTQSQAQNQAPNQAENQAGPNNQNTQSAPQPQAQGQTPGQNGQTPQGQGNQEGGNQPNQPRQPSLHLRRATTTTRAHAVSLAGLVYDRFLHCESPHGRRRLQRRREQAQQQVLTHERLRNERINALNIEALVDRNINITQRIVEHIIEMINSPPTSEGYVSAVLTAIARHLFLSEMTQGPNGEPLFIPHEFRGLRNILRDFMQGLMARARPGDGDHAFETIADNLVDENMPFLQRMYRLTRMRPEFDYISSVRVLIRSRLPAVIASLMSDSTSQTFVARFYSIFARLFMDLCSLLFYFCEDGVGGVRTLYNAYLREILEGVDDSVRHTIMALSEANMNGVATSIAANVDNIRPFIRVRDHSGNPPLPPLPPREEPSPMEVSPGEAEDRLPTLLEDIPLPDSEQPNPAPTYDEPESTNEPDCDLCSVCHMPTDSGPSMTVFETIQAARQASTQEIIQRATDRALARAAQRVAAEQAAELEEEIAAVEAAERAAERAVERVAERASGRSAERAAYWIAERAKERAAERTAERVAEQAEERAAQLAAERVAERAAELGTTERTAQRLALRAYERATRMAAAERAVEREAERAANEAAQRVFVDQPVITQPVEQVQVEAEPEPTPEPTPSAAPQRSPNSNSPSNVRLVPPMVIVQHWGEEWVPVLSRDQQSQGAAPPPEPYSDAYLSGMPSRKRRRVRQTRPATTLDGFMNESVREAASERTPSMDNQALRFAFREHMRQLARHRALASEDYDPLRYASAARFLNTRTNRKESPDSDGQDKKK